MKYKVLFLYALLFALMGCSHNAPRPDVNPETCLPEGWQPMPQDRVKAYIPFNDGDKALYISDNGDSLVLMFDHYQFVYRNTFCDIIRPGSEALPYESIGVSIMFSNRDEKINGYISFYMCQRVFLAAFFHFTDSDVAGDSDGIAADFREELANDESLDQGAGWPRYPNEFVEHLTDTIVLKNGYNPTGPETETYALLVSGRGIIWFVDSNGVKWHLQD